MPAYVYTGPSPVVYPETRDAHDRHLGQVEPGDIRDFDEPPDSVWAAVSRKSGRSRPLAGPSDPPESQTEAISKEG
jgi:hypothetical protein